MVASALRTIQYFNLPNGLVAGVCLPPSFIAGKMMLVRAIVGNWELLIEKPSNSPFAEVQGKIDFTAITPPMLDWLVSHRPDFLKKINTVIVGGGQIPDSFLQSLVGFENNIFATYGMTETLTHVAAKKVSGPGDPYYTAVPGVHFDVDERQCLKIFDEHLAASPFQTNDMVILIDSQHFEWRARIDFVINSGAIKLFPEEMEQFISSLIGSAFFIGAHPSERWGQRPMWVIEGEERDLSSALSQIESKFGKIALPEKVIYFPELLRSHTGKLLRIIPKR